MADHFASYNFHNISPIDPTIQADSFSAFKPLFTRGSEAASAKGLLGGGINGVVSFEHESVIWRGKDKPYILSGPGVFNGGGGKRAKNGVIQAPFLVTLATDYDNGDYYTTSTCSHCGNTHTEMHNEDDTFPYPENITVKPYRGVNKPTGSETSPSSLTIPMLITNNTTYHASGRMIQSTTPVTFYPTIRMTWQNVSQYGSKNDASVRSEQLSTIIPNNYAEAGWFNESYESNKPTMNLKSNQWSTHVRATQPDPKIKDSNAWRGINQVLPGGAI